jgi:hypothetical protein
VDWTEEGALPGTVTLRFEGVNSDALERIEVENFQRGLSTPQAEDPGGTAFAEGRRTGAMTPETAFGVALGVVFGGIAFAIGGSLDLGTGVGFALVFAAFLLGVGTPPLVRYLLVRRGASRGVVMTETFTIEATNDAMTVRGASIGSVTVPLDDLVEVIAAPRLGWRDRSGTFKPFPCGFTLNTKNVAIAGKLQEIATQMRTMRGYRGA